MTIRWEHASHGSWQGSSGEFMCRTAPAVARATPQVLRKASNQPMDHTETLEKNRLSLAITRRGTLCQRWPSPGKRRCHFHGGAPGSGAPEGPRNGAYRHGRYYPAPPVTNCFRFFGESNEAGCFGGPARRHSVPGVANLRPDGRTRWKLLRTHMKMPQGLKPAPGAPNRIYVDAHSAHWLRSKRLRCAS